MVTDHIGGTPPQVFLQWSPTTLGEHLGHHPVNHHVRTQENLKSHLLDSEVQHDSRQDKLKTISHFRYVLAGDRMFWILFIWARLKLRLWTVQVV